MRTFFCYQCDDFGMVSGPCMIQCAETANPPHWCPFVTERKAGEVLPATEATWTTERRREPREE
ncbi:MAG: hypothetical protein WC683_01800 [bacterium]